MNTRIEMRKPLGGRSRQRGVVLLFSLIALVIMLIAAVAMVRSFNSSLFNAGNIGFKRDMQNQSERAVAEAIAEFSDGGNLNSAAQRSADRPNRNYSATLLPTDTHGIPTDLVLADADFAAKYTKADLHSGDAAGSVKVRYIVDRLCSTSGDESLLSSGSCTLANDPAPAGTSSTNLRSAGSKPLCPTCTSASPQRVVYRISIKVTGPRDTQSFFQTTFTAPSSS